MTSLFFLSRSIALLLAPMAVGILGTLPLEAAEWVVIKYKIFSESISVPDLSNFVDTGELTPELKAHLRNTRQKPEQVRKALGHQIPADPLLLSQFLNSLPGQMLLDYISEIVHTPSERASRQALRGALITSALKDGRIAIIEVLENYGSPEVHLEGERLMEMVERVEKVLRYLPRVRF